MSELEHLLHNKTIKGVFVLDDQALDDLDDMLNEAWDQMVGLKKQSIDREVRKRRSAIKRREDFGGLSTAEKKRYIARIRNEVQSSYQFSPEKREISISFKSGNKVTKQAFSEARTDPELKAERIAKFEVVLRAADHRLELDLDVDAFLGTSFRISASPQASDFANEHLGKLWFWADRLNAPWWQRKWRGIAGFHWFLFALLYWIAWGVASVPSAIESDMRKAELKKTAHELLNDGIDDDEIPEAIEVTLALLSDFPGQSDATTRKTYRYRSFWVFISVCFVLSIMLSFPPRTAIAIGRGGHTIERQRMWLRIITIAIPSFVVLGVVASALGSAVFESIRKTLQW